jgi:histidinol phosphatase-like enzyme (inositol monophosphatase family)
MADTDQIDAATAAEVTEMVRTAGDRALGWFRQPIAIDNKLAEIGGYDPVTEADLAVEDELRAALADRFPGDRILGEERGESGEGARRWVIDPIDGTRAFVTGNVLWGTLVGLQHDNRVLAGWIHLPATGETYVAADGSAWLTRGDERRELATSGVTTVEAATLCSTHPEMFLGEGELEAFERVQPRVKLSRYGGDCANYGLLALGTVDLIIEASLNPYDIMGPIAIIEAAGGTVTDRTGAPAVDGGFVIAAGTAELHAAALELVDAD